MEKREIEQSLLTRQDAMICSSREKKMAISDWLKEMLVLANRLIAREIFERYCVNDGVCLDVGCGLGWMGIELSRLSGIQVVLLDINRDVLSKARLNACSHGVNVRCFPLRADAHHLPFREETMNLIISRGSIFFWEDPPKALRDIHRVLKKNGMVFIGGGFGRKLPSNLKKEILREVKKAIRNHSAEAFKKWKKGREIESFRKWLSEAKLSCYKLIKDPFDIWVEITKT